METIKQILTLFGGVSVFVYGLKQISENAERLIGGRIEKRLTAAVKNPFGGLAVGAVASAIAQSSIAVNMMTVGFAGGSVPFYGLTSVVVGANIGTTVTAQIISVSGLDGAAVWIFFAFLGLILSLFKGKGVRSTGGALIGLGLMFAGLVVMGDEINGLEKLAWFRGIFLSDDKFLLFLGGMALTGITQSSSGVTGVMILLAGKGLMEFGNAAFMILGSNVGSCFAVVVASINKGDEKRAVAWFNLAFNLIGALIFMPFLFAFGDGIGDLFTGSTGDAGRAIANFHTVFNVLSAAAVMPFIKPLSSLTLRLVSGKKSAKKAVKGVSGVKRAVKIK